MTLDTLRAGFPITEHAIYMDHAAVSPISSGVQAAMLRQTSIQVHNMTTSGQHFAREYADLRGAIARMTGATSANVAFIQNTSHGLSLIANGQPWKPGDNVVVPAMDFPSNFLPWKRLESLGVECRLVETPNGRVTADAISSALDSRTRIVAMSGVQYFNGYRPDLAAIADPVRRNGSFLVVDGTQGAGAFDFNLPAHGIDALVVSAHKWMLGPLGIGFMALSDTLLERTEPTEVGWLSVNDPFEFRRELDWLPSAEKFEPGTENSAGLFGLMERLREIEAFELPLIENRILELNDLFAEQLKSLGGSITSPWEDGRRSGILTFQHPNIDPVAAVQALKGRGIFTSARHGNIRISPHYYNSEAEVREVIDQIGGFVV
ncbi:MAG: aminotransferase class V-fold PLP-dependent enzyme [Alphaproteobacteria bacterium]|jgi:cysteine desulfurase/selenocysteine lyase|nr:aminotransferase class V-fold PLP-dependent enzyme [Alphaproteobacteria bacterium]